MSSGAIAADNPSARTLILGSHYDTVRNAGRYDGRLGILTALVVVEHLHRSGRKLPFHVDVIAFSEEEGVRFSTPYIGSSAIAGKFDAEHSRSARRRGQPIARRHARGRARSEGHSGACARAAGSDRLSGGAYRARSGVAAREPAGGHRHLDRQLGAAAREHHRRSGSCRNGADGACAATRPLPPPRLVLYRGATLRRGADAGRHRRASSMCRAAPSTSFRATASSRIDIRAGDDQTRDAAVSDVLARDRAHRGTSRCCHRSQGNSARRQCAL